MQILLPLIPAGASHIAGSLNVFCHENQWSYFLGANLFYFHDVNDLQSFKAITSSLIDTGCCKKKDIVRFFGVSDSSVKRSLKKFRKHGFRAFYQPRKGRGGSVLANSVLETVQERLYQGATRSEICEEFGIKRDTLKKAIYSGRLYEPSQFPQAHNNRTNKSQRSQQDSVWSMGTACEREDERILAALGALHGAAIEFKPCNDLSFGGVLCALPALEVNGLFAFLQRFSLPQGFYDVIHIVLVLAYMALCRIKSPERLRFESPGELGKLIGLDRVPEAKTLRKKIKLICESADAREWMLELSKFYMEQYSQLAGVLYVDGHVRTYHGGQTKLPRRYVSRQRLCLRGTTDYYVNDALGQPFFVVSKAVNQGMIAVLKNEIVPQLIEDVPTQPSEEELKVNPLLHRFIMVFDREASSNKLFKEMWTQYRIVCMSYQKNVKDKWAETEFIETTVSMPDGETVEMKLAERGTLLGNAPNSAWVKEVRKLKSCGHQTSVVTTAYTLPADIIAGAMFSRWSQENFFAYMMREYNIDRILRYGVEEFPDPKTQVINPEYRRLDNHVKSLTSRHSRVNAEFRAAELKCDSGPGKNLEKAIARKSRLLEELEAFEEEIRQTKSKRKEVSHHIRFEDLPDDEKFNQLLPGEKAFSDTIKLLAYRAETAIASTLREKLGKQDDARRLACDLMRSEVDLIPDEANKELHIHLHRMANPQADRAVKNLLEELNKTETNFPATDWKLVYHLIGESS
ncbi:MAG: hypothetical protein PHS31_04055 [Victivallaceae bacterium]|nr:hypothetical protein [Victivallaceae bacterium]